MAFKNWRIHWVDDFDKIPASRNKHLLIIFKILLPPHLQLCIYTVAMPA
jgi:hypothetical protein